MSSREEAEKDTDFRPRRIEKNTDSVRKKAVKRYGSLSEKDTEICPKTNNTKPRPRRV
jgi:hypothetical protein